MINAKNPSAKATTATIDDSCNSGSFHLYLRKRSISLFIFAPRSGLYHSSKPYMPSYCFRTSLHPLLFQSQRLFASESSPISQGCPILRTHADTAPRNSLMPFHCVRQLSRCTGYSFFRNILSPLSGIDMHEVACRQYNSMLPARSDTTPGSSARPSLYAKAYLSRLQPVQQRFILFNKFSFLPQTLLPCSIPYHPVLQYRPTHSPLLHHLRLAARPVSVFPLS